MKPSDDARVMATEAEVSLKREDKVPQVQNENVLKVNDRVITATKTGTAQITICANKTKSNYVMFENNHC